jgi:hypothetical protein
LRELLTVKPVGLPSINSRFASLRPTWRWDAGARRDADGDLIHEYVWAAA